MPKRTSTCSTRSKRISQSRNTTTPTISDVAKKAGVSIATVSKVLNRKYLHSTEKKERVLQAVRDLDYQPNRAAAHLATRTFTPTKRRNLIPIAFVYRGEAPGQRPPQFQRRVSDIVNECKRLGYHLESVDLHGVERESTVFRQLYARGIEGLLIGPVYPLNHSLEFDASRFSIVGVGLTPATSHFHHITFNPFLQFSLLWQHVYEKGYRRIGSAVMRHPEEFSDDWARLACAEMMQKKFLAPEDQIPPYTGLIKQELTEFGEWFRTHRPDAVISFSSSIYYYLRDQLGLQIPRDVGFALLHGAATLPAIRHLTSVDVRYQHMAPHALDLLDQLIRHGEKGVPDIPRAVMLTPKLLEGTTL